MFGKLLEDLGYHVTMVPAIVNIPEIGFGHPPSHVFLAVSISHSGQSLLALLFVLAAISAMAPNPDGVALGERVLSSEG